MGSVKVKFRCSTIKGEPGIIYYQIIHRRIARQKKTDYRIYPDEWNRSSSEIILPPFSSKRWEYLSDISIKIREDVKRFHEIIALMEKKRDNYTSDDVLMAYSESNPEQHFLKFMMEIIRQQREWGKIRTSENYLSAYRSFKRFRKGRDLTFNEITEEMMKSYEAYLHRQGVTPNSSSFYMRILRAVYNRAVVKEYVVQRSPFKRVYTGVGKTIKRGLAIHAIKYIKDMTFSKKPHWDFARDMFIFSFYTRGMAFVDMAFLKKSDLRNGVLTYRRRKTGQRLTIKWEKCMQQLIDKYNTAHTPYLLPIIMQPGTDEWRQYIYMRHNVNRSLKALGERLGIPITLTLYVARHAWASIARNRRVPLSVISEAMGHDSESTTRIYLATLDTVAVDKANKMILDLL